MKLFLAVYLILNYYFLIKIKINLATRITRQSNFVDVFGKLLSYA